VEDHLLRRATAPWMGHSQSRVGYSTKHRFQDESLIGRKVEEFGCACVPWDSLYVFMSFCCLSRQGDALSKCLIGIELGSLANGKGAEKSEGLWVYV
jgi:hypothetical protein